MQMQVISGPQKEPRTLLNALCECEEYKGRKRCHVGVVSMCRWMQFISQSTEEGERGKAEEEKSIECKWKCILEAGV